MPDRFDYAVLSELVSYGRTARDLHVRLRDSGEFPWWSFLFGCLTRRGFSRRLADMEMRGLIESRFLWKKIEWILFKETCYMITDRGKDYYAGPCAKAARARREMELS